MKIIHLTKGCSGVNLAPEAAVSTVKSKAAPPEEAYDYLHSCWCSHGKEPRIVLCSDWQQQIEGIGAAETRNKLDWVKNGWPVLVSDTLCHADALVRVYADHLRSVELTEENILSEMKIPAQQYKGILANDYVQQMLGVDYNYFLQYGKRRFPDDFFREKTNEVARIRLGASLIISGFVVCTAIGPYKQGLNSFLFAVEDNDVHQNVVTQQTDFAAIGSGAYNATAALFHRGQHLERDLMYTIYSVFEAKRFTDGVPGVGEALSIDVLEPQGGIRQLSDAGYDYCEKLYARFGPRQISKTHKNKFEMRDEFLEPFDTDSNGAWE